jgi:hypothetical protein
VPIHSKDVATLSQLVDEALAVYNTRPEGHFLWWRGVACETYKLLPKIMRDGKVPEQVFEREERLLTRFRQRSMAYWKAGYAQSDWDHLFAMQHYGLPTRLLDWSENLFVSTYFALSGAQNTGHAHEGACVPVVWCIDPIAWNRATPFLSEYGDSVHVLTTASEEAENFSPRTVKKRVKTPIALFGSHNSERIVAQRGTFMVWGNESSPLEKFCEQDSLGVLWKFRLTGNQAEMFKSIQGIGFTETMIFPELSYLADELSRVEGWR